ncbi:transglycosylase domain-containing protein [Streptomyces palmae]|uniref:Penicillin-binding protein n=1 Tax=Streptomyces palmae TaxID=1701085 RepID=A0A4Z0HF42_9ACTN|nr:transglycosylase domain-containing protein [Streptomyces palmae]TGB17492.1 penicillin-binding protein [Streptomyces palmae]
MSEHRRKPPQPQGGGRAAARRAAQQSSGHRAAPPPSGQGAQAEPPGEAARPHGGRAEARRAAQRGGRRRAADPAGAGHASGAPEGGRRGRGGKNRPPGKKRFIDYPRRGKTGFKRWVPSWKLVTGTFLSFVGLLVAAAGIGLMLVQVPDPAAAAESQKNVYYWADGRQMVVSGGGDYNRQIVPLSKIPKSMQSAVIAAENASFYSDSGVDPMGIARAVVNMAKGGATQSGSTITQQYVKNTYLGQEQTLKRKVTELFISVKVGWTQDKDDILAGYLNTAFYGRGAYGIQAASRAYYGKDSEELNPSESAFLAATLNGPNLYDPAGGIGRIATKKLNTERATNRWKWILKREVETGHMTEADRAKWVDKGFPRPEPPRPATNKGGQIGYLTDLADQYIIEHTNISKAQLDKGGYQIHTTFERDKVNKLKTAVEKVSKENINPKLRPRTDKYVQFGGASVEPGTGKIVAIYGGKNALEHWHSNAIYTGAQVGSTFKPFVLAAAMRDGVRDPKLGPEQPLSARTKVSPTSVYNGDNKVTLLNYDKTVWHDEKGREWHQANDDNGEYGPVDLRTAMEHSVNTAYMQLGMDVGVDKVRQAAKDAGMDEKEFTSLTPTFSLGTSAPSAINLANAYATFAARGQQVDPYSVETIEHNGVETWSHDEVKKEEQAFDTNVADNVTDVLQSVVENGTGKNARIGRPAAGKTGTTDDNKSAWFAGYTPQLSTAIGMWRMDDQAEVQSFLPMYGVGGQDKIHGASFPSEIWADYMREAMDGVPVKQFPEPGPIGDKIYGDGASPDPTTQAPTQSPSTEEPSEEPSKEPTEDPTTKKPTEDPSPTDSCGPLDPLCGDNGNGGPGGRPGGPGGKPTSPTTDPTDGDSGAFFGGPPD